MKNLNHPSSNLTSLGPVKSYGQINRKQIAVILFLSMFSFSGFSQVNDLPISQEKLIRGIYKTFEDFKNNDPISTDSFYVESKERKIKNWKGTYSLTPRYVENGKKIKKVWGFCDGTTVYVSHQKEFFPIEMLDNNYVFSGYGQKRGSVKGGGVALAAGEVIMSAPILGAFAAVPLLLTGGIIAASTASSYKKDKIEYSINLRNGKPEYYTSN